jgi:rubrerythrin
MRRQALLDKLSEFLMHEQGGLMLYRAAAGRARDPELRAKYHELGRQTARHREVLVAAIRRLGGDPDYVSPTAKVTQCKADALLQSSALVTGALSPDELEVNDLENILLAETKDHANWHLLEQVATATGDLDVRLALEGAVREVEAEEDYHVSWARETLSRKLMRLLTLGPAPSPERWQSAWTGPTPPIEQQHPAPVVSGSLLSPARQPAWGETPLSRDMRRTG